MIRNVAQELGEKLALHEPQHRLHSVIGDAARAIRNGLIREREAIAHTALSSGGNPMQGV